MSLNLTFGVDYYPEQWSESRWASDADRMRDFGFSQVRIMEFAWAIVESGPGNYDFSLFDRAIAVLASRGLSVIIGTPTATFPVWLAERDPSIFQVHPSRMDRDFGMRRNGCYNNPAYKEAAAALVAEVARHFGSRPEVAGFQVDNEIGHEGSDLCVCANCAAEWAAWLERKYGSVDALNADWGTVFWSTTYARFDQVPVPRSQPATNHNPALLVDYYRFSSDSAAAWARAQTRELRSRASPSQFITTNLYPPSLAPVIDMEDLSEGMDFVSWDNYPVWGDQDEPHPYPYTSFSETFVRGLRDDAPFAVMEEMSGIQGHACLGHLPPERQVALWTVQAIARGANRIVYFRWRTAPFAQEQLCHGLLDTDDRETERGRAIRETMARAKSCLEGLASVRVPAAACVLYSKDDSRLLRDQYLSRGLRFSPAPWCQAGYDRELSRWAEPYAVFNVNYDVASVLSAKLDRYKIISLPLYQLADPAFAARLSDWVGRGGTLVLGFRAGTRDLRNWNVAEPLPGAFADLAGIRIPRFESLGETSASIRVGARGGKGLVWADIIEPETAKPVAYWSDRGKFYRGSPCATVNAFGKGRVWYLGTSPDSRAMFLLYRRIFRESGVRTRYLGYGIEAVSREDSSGEPCTILMNHTPRPKRAMGKRLGPWGWTVAAGK